MADTDLAGHGRAGPDMAVGSTELRCTGHPVTTSFRRLTSVRTNQSRSRLTGRSTRRRRWAVQSAPADAGCAAAGGSCSSEPDSMPTSAPASLAHWLLNQEARAMLRRIDRVKPFSLLET